jgi:hypothetical protein
VNAPNSGVPVGAHWNLKQVFSGGDGIIYAIQDNGDLLWYRHDGRNDATFRWASNEGKKVGVARPLILRITISGAFLALNCENQPHGFGTG